jgi:hypothetical protein
MMIPVIREYLAAQQAYETARLAVIEAFAQEVQAWTREQLTERQILDMLRIFRVPEDLLTEILEAARHPEEPVRP